MIPTESVVPELGGHKVYLKKNGKVKPVEVEIGLRTEREIQILSGIALNDTVLVSGILQVRPGMDIKVNLVNNNLEDQAP